jgi:hypothetical protein
LVGKNTLSAVARTISLSLPAGRRDADGICADEEYAIPAFPYNQEPSLRRPTPCNVSLELRVRRAQRRIGAGALTALAGLALLASGCGSNQKQDVSEPNGTFPLAVQTASFPADQKLAKSSRMVIVVRNAGSKTVPEVSVTVKCPGQGQGENGGGGGFQYTTSQKGVADPNRPQFVVDKIPTRTPRPKGGVGLDPLERSSAFVDTYPLGKLAPGGSVNFTWDVTAVRAGPYRLCWRINAGLYGKAKAVAAASSAHAISGEFQGTVSRKAPIAEVTPSGKVVEVPSVQPTR